MPGAAGHDRESIDFARLQHELRRLPRFLDGLERTRTAQARRQFIQHRCALAQEFVVRAGCACVIEIFTAADDVQRPRLDLRAGQAALFKLIGQDQPVHASSAPDSIGPCSCARMANSCSPSPGTLHTNASVLFRSAAASLSYSPAFQLPMAPLVEH